MLQVARANGLGIDWPGRVKIDQLVAKANGLFIWVQVAKNYLLPSGHSHRVSMNDHLDSLLSITPVTAMSPLFQLYKVALDEVAGPIVDNRKLLGMITWEVKRFQIGGTHEDMRDRTA